MSIKDYFLRYNEALSNDFILSGDGRLELLSTDIQDWRIAFVNTGLNALIGQRLRAVQNHVGDDEMFLANYGDNLTDAPLDTLIEDFRGRDKVAAFLSVAPTTRSMSSRCATTGVARDRGRDGLGPAHQRRVFIFRREIFDYIRPGEELVEEPFQRLIAEGQLIAYPHDGFWAPMDTLKDMQNLEALYDAGRPPWAVWQVREEEAAPSPTEAAPSAAE